MFAVHRIDEQLAKAMDRKVWLPSGGTLVIDRTEAMTVVDVNTGKFTGSGGNLEQTVTKNNLEAAEEIVRQLRLRDIGGIVVIDFIDMVLESNRDLVLRRLTEALARDRTRHQVSEVTSLGLVQLTRKRLGTGLIEAFSTNCQECSGRGIVLHADPVDNAAAPARKARAAGPPGRRHAGGRRGRRGGKGAPRRRRWRAYRRTHPENTRCSRPWPRPASPMTKTTQTAQTTTRTPLERGPRGPTTSPTTRRAGGWRTTGTTTTTDDDDDDDEDDDDDDDRDDDDDSTMTTTKTTTTMTTRMTTSNSTRSTRTPSTTTTIDEDESRDPRRFRRGRLRCRASSAPAGPGRPVAARRPAPAGALRAV